MFSIKQFIPENYRPFVRDLQQKYRKSWQEFQQEFNSVWRGWKYLGNKVYCPCCNGNFSEFLPFSTEVRQN